MTPDIDEDADLSTLDRGDAFEGADDDQPDRDAQGRFVAAEDKDAAQVAADLAAAAALAADPDGTAAAEAAAAEAAAAEAAAAEAAAAEAADDEDKQNLPLRLNKMRDQRDAERQRADAALAELERLKALAKPAPVEKVDPIAELSAELDTLYEKVEEARADGNVAEAAKLQRQIDAGNRAMMKLEAEQIVTTVTTTSSENQRYDAMLDVIEAGVPHINAASEEFSRASVERLEFHVAAYEKMGMAPSAALREASTLLFGFDPLKPAAAKAEDTPAPKKPEAPAGKKPDPAKAVDTQRRQPPAANDLGTNNDSTKIKVENLSDDEFNALPESKKAEMRGDFG